MYLLDTSCCTFASAGNLFQVGFVAAVLFPQVGVPGMEITSEVDWLESLFDLNQGSAIDVPSRRISFNILLDIVRLYEQASQKL